MFLRTLAAIAALLLVSCGSARLSVPGISPYRMEIQQGNFVSQEMVSQLKLGMSKDQVRFVLGTALITDSFHADRWDYVFRRQRPNSNELEQHKLAVFFEDGKLVRMDGDVTPAAGTDAAAIKTPEAKPEALAKPVSGAVSESKPAAQAAGEVSKPPPPAVPEKSTARPPAAEPVPSADNKPQEEKGWWERLKDRVRF